MKKTAVYLNILYDVTLAGLSDNCCSLMSAVTIQGQESQITKLEVGQMLHDTFYTGILS